MKKALPTLCVLTAATLWGSMGLFVRRLNAAGLYALEVTQLRILVGLVLVGAYLAVFHRDMLRVRLRDLWCFAGSGICSLLFFSYCYFTGMTMTSLSVICVLLYTAPVFVMLLSVLLFRERMTRSKLLALLLTFSGCCLVSGLGGETHLSGAALLLGLGSGFFYGLYSIFSRYAIQRGYSSWTITFYTFAFCTVACLFLSDWSAITSTVSADPTLLVWIVLLGLVTAFFPYVLYTRGLEQMESSRAAILASLEPAVATLLGVLVLHEPLTVSNAAGIVLVLGGIAVLSLGNSRKA